MRPPMGYLGDGRLGLNFGRFGRFDPKKWENGRLRPMGDLGWKKMGEPNEKNMGDGRFGEKSGRTGD